MPVTPDAGHRRARIAQGLERPLAAELRDDIGADDGDETKENEETVARLAEEDRADPRGQQQEHERFGGRLDHHSGHRRPARRFDRVRPVPLGALDDLAPAETHRRIHGEARRDRPRRRRMRLQLGT
jgi:hypothetical protein